MVTQQIRQRQEFHALMMGHEFRNDGIALSAQQARRCVIARFEQAVFYLETFGRNLLQITTGFFRRDPQGGQRRIRGRSPDRRRGRA